MGDPVTINLRHLARGLGVPLRQIQAVLELLDEGNTVPFITRYRKDQTGGLDEEQIRQIQARLVKMRQLAERKQTILRSIEAQGKLSETLAKQIQAASTAKRLEDLYLPYKPKKQTLATLARSRGLEILAGEILAADPACADLDRRAADFVNLDRQIPTAAEALLGAGHILAEQFSERAELRQKLREVLQRTGKLVSAQIGEPKPAAERPPQQVEQPSSQTVAAASIALPLALADPLPIAEQERRDAAAVSLAAETAAPQLVETAAPQLAETAAPQAAEASAPQPAEPAATHKSEGIVPGVVTAVAAEPVETATIPPPVAAALAEEPAETAGATVTEDSADGSAASPGDALADGASPADAVAPAPDPRPPTPDPQTLPAGSPASERPRQKPAKSEKRLSKKEQKKKRVEEKRHKAFSDYFSYQEEIRKIPPHRILAINRGERAKVLRVKVECDMEAMYQALDEECIPAGHPHADLLRGCARDALARLILPSLDREIRRELTERAENHAVEVFAKNLRNLLLQPPVCDRRLLAMDPGFKNGCKLAALDQFGNVLEHGLIYLIGKPDRKEEAKKVVLDLVQRLELTVIAVGNGTACRETEDFIAELIGNELAGKVCYVIVNEAGASVYSTSRIGREEFPHFDATLRGAVSIGRRLLDPLSELVKIEPANIGVGLYQHDVKARHLAASLDEVVESCVNYVGVDANTASPALLRYVSGLNQLTARRLYEQRLQAGPFRNRQQLKEVPGVGEATFVQAAGFLKLTSGDNPLDATWIHPESYEITGRVLSKLESTPADLLEKQGQARLQERIANVDVKALAAELGVGELSLRDILSQLARPGRDPREDLPAPVFKQGILKLEDLAPGMELRGTVLNVVDFGAFVDIGMHDSGLVHVSQLADKFVRDPHDVVAVGDIIKVWVVEVDKQRRRVSLSMIPPGTQRIAGRRHESRPAAPPPAPEGEPPPARAPRPPRPPQRHPRPQGAASRETGPQGPRPQQGRRPPPPPRPEYKPKRPPKPITPLTDEMRNGKAPLRSFSDLAQFFQVKHEPPPEEEPKKKNDDQEQDPTGQT
jgi:uncharacterized protein